MANRDEDITEDGVRELLGGEEDLLPTDPFCAHLDRVLTDKDIAAFQSSRST